MKEVYYRLKKILATQAHYHVIIGERSNGKTYAVLEYGLSNYINNGEQMAIIRRYEEDYKGKRGKQMFENLVENGVIAKLTKNEWSGVYYYASKWYLCNYDEETGKRHVADEEFCYAFSLASMEHDKSTGYPKVKTILFDEFISRNFYLTDEFVLYMNVLSTIIRRRKGVKIFMCGNTINKYCPHFNEMGLKHIKQMKPGDIDLYHYGNSELTVAVEYCAPNKEGKESDVYFAFDNPKLKMITGGEWELDIYPHLPEKYKPNEVEFIYFICFDEDILQCEIINKGDYVFTYIHLKTTALKDTDNDLIYSTDYNPRFNWRRNILKPYLPIEKAIYEQFRNDKVFYQDNEIGEIVRNYLMWCKKN